MTLRILLLSMQKKSSKNYRERNGNGIEINFFDAIIMRMEELKYNH